MRKRGGCPIHPELRSHPGYTLVELLVVVAIISMVMGVVFFNIDSLTPTTRLYAAARRLGASVEFAASEAALRAAPVRVVYDLDAGTWQIALPVSGSQVHEQLAGFGTLLHEKTDAERLPAGVRFKDVMVGSKTYASGTVVVPFAAEGFAGSHHIHLVNADGLEYTVALNTLTGLASFHDGYQQPRFVKELR